MIQQGQVFELKGRGADGRPLWAYRHRLDGRDWRGRRWAALRAVRRRNRRCGRRSSDFDGVGAPRR